MGNPSGYDIASFGAMIECEPRMATYAEALRQAITPGCTVIDIGAGFGIFSMLACKYGAGSVIAIEPDPSAELLMPMARANGCADRITVIRDLSTRYTPPTKADVIVSDIRGVLPLFEHLIPTIIDARERLLAPGGRLIPMRDVIRVALVHAPEHYLPCERPWLKNNYGLDLTEGHRFAVNIRARASMKPEALMAEPCDLAVLDYHTIADPSVDSTVEFTAERTQTAHGLLLWFDADLAEGVQFSNSPRATELIYKQQFLPFERPVKIAAGERLRARVRAMFQDGDYIVSWDTDIAASALREAPVSFRQSTFKGAVFTPARLRPHAHDQVPATTAQIMIDRDCLSLVGEDRTLEDIALALMEQHPGAFGSAKAALDHVTKLLERYRS